MFLKIIEKLKNLKTHLMAIHISNFILYSIYRFIQTHKLEFELLNDDNKRKIENYEEIKKQNEIINEQNIKLQMINKEITEEKSILENKILLNDKEKLIFENKTSFNRNFFDKDDYRYNYEFDNKYNIINKSCKPIKSKLDLQKLSEKYKNQKLKYYLIRKVLSNQKIRRKYDFIYDENEIEDFIFIHQYICSDNNLYNNYYRTKEIFKYEDDFQSEIFLDYLLT